MPLSFYKYNNFEVAVDLDSIGIVSCRDAIIEVCGHVRTSDGMFSQYICTQVRNSKSFREALRRLEKQIEEELCSGADEPELCAEYHEDRIKEEACDKIDPEYILPYVDMEELVEALANAARDHIPQRKTTILDYISRPR